MPMMKIYAAYGSNMNEEQMKKRCPQSELMGIGWLKDYKLMFKTHANVTPSNGDKVPVMLWKISEKDEKSLDSWEGVYSGSYVKRELEVEYEGEKIKALFYIMNEENKPNLLPTADYFNLIYSGYKKFNLSCEPLFKALFEAWELREHRDLDGGEYLLYVAYGSNLVIEEMKDRCPKSFPLTKGIIKDYKLAFNIHADIRECEGSYVPVGLWAVNRDDLERLDYYEGYPSYYNKKTVKVCVGERELEALVYYMTDQETENKPYSSYMNRIKQGYEDFGIS